MSHSNHHHHKGKHHHSRHHHVKDPEPLNTVESVALQRRFSLIRYLRHALKENCCGDESVANIVSIQEALPWSWFKLYLELVSLSATGIVFILLFPFWHSMGQPRVTVHLCIVLTLAQYATSFVKDTFCVARPPSPPVKKTGGTNYKLEYGFPSGHTSGAFLLAYINARALVEQYHCDPFVVYPIALSYAVTVASSRVYLGMHWISDVAAGAVVGNTIICWHLLLGGEQQIDSTTNALWHVASASLTAASRGTETALMVVFAIGVGIVMLLVHPSPDGKCPCFVDSARFVGAGVGAVLGTWHRKYLESVFHVPDLTAPSPRNASLMFVVGMVALRTVVSMVAMILAETVVKIVAEKLLQIFVFPNNKKKQQNINQKKKDKEKNNATTAPSPSRINCFWDADYILSRYLSHVAFAYVLCGWANVFVPLLGMA